MEESGLNYFYYTTYIGLFQAKVPICRSKYLTFFPLRLIIRVLRQKEGHNDSLFFAQKAEKPNIIIITIKSVFFSARLNK
jgi:hypothetical protein